MSLMKTLAKVAIGVAVAKGAQSLMNRGTKGGTSGGLGGLLGGLTGGTPGEVGHGQRGTTAKGGLQDMLGGLFGGNTSMTGGAAGGLGGLLESIGGSRGTGGLGGMLGGLAGAAGAGGLLAGSRNAVRRHPEKENASFGAVLNSQFDSTPEPEIEPSQDQEALAALMLAAMIQAAKSDGVFDAEEKARLMEHLGEVDADDAAFIEAQMQAPVDVDALVRETPEGMGPQIYAVSLLAIDLDTQQEAQYLHKLAQAYGMTPDAVNEIHADMGVPSLYT
ncbi:protein YebE [Sulfitobacter alexandrii]|uniref:Protein YebE n=1 Tax=Sulfitobacter alexandrii TaxID=1917485 RepID=A0A1J0WHB8_9RHOB|nr:DUF533 domain-containing protein [Sulfitobacter alexandrii]APE43724.1 protein YebE [Sulfitobacter alexandrii]